MIRQLIKHCALLPSHVSQLLKRVIERSKLHQLVSPEIVTFNDLRRWGRTRADYMIELITMIVRLVHPWRHALRDALHPACSRGCCTWCTFAVSVRTYMDGRSANREQVKHLYPVRLGLRTVNLQVDTHGGWMRSAASEISTESYMKSAHWLSYSC